MSTEKLAPVLKWAGGKTQILDIILSKMPQVYNKYHEPFLGGASVLFGIKPKQAFINDINAQLMNLYSQLKYSVDSVIERLNIFDSVQCDKNAYYGIREKYNKKILSNELDDECAALIIWLNKHCFNGLYRVNNSGLFNVPYNNKTNGKSYDEDNIRAVSYYLNHSEIFISCLDFEKACESVLPGDFVYFDSPYIPESETANFTDYTSNGFTYDDHERLSYLFKKLDSLGAKLMLSNNDVPLIHSLYSDYNIFSFNTKRMINCDAAKRTGREVIITNY